MKELTQGELQYIRDSLNPWEMMVQMLRGQIGTIPEELSEQIEELKRGYLVGFEAYYRENAGENPDADALLMAFDRKWGPLHPEFYDMRKLFSGCDKEALKRAEEGFAYLEERL